MCSTVIWPRVHFYYFYLTHFYLFTIQIIYFFLLRLLAFGNCPLLYLITKMMQTYFDLFNSLVFINKFDTISMYCNFIKLYLYFIWITSTTNSGDRNVK